MSKGGGYIQTDNGTLQLYIVEVNVTVRFRILIRVTTCLGL